TPSTAPRSSDRRRSAGPRGSGEDGRRARRRSQRRRSSVPTPVDRPTSWRAREALPRSCARSSCHASALPSYGSDRNGRKEALDEPTIRLIIEVLLHNLRCAGEREIDGLTTQIGDRARALHVDFRARALEQLML